MDTPQTVRALSALAHEARLAVFKLLVAAGLLEQRPDGRRIHYSANFDAMNALVAYLADNCCGGAPCILDGTSAALHC